MAGQKETLPLEFRKMASKGDKILNNYILNELVSNDIPNSGEVKQLLKSNEFIQYFPIPYDLKHKVVGKDWHNINGKKRVFTNIQIIGDHVEAWIAFLADNYGLDKAHAYIKKNVIKIIKEYYPSYIYE